MAKNVVSVAARIMGAFWSLTGLLWVIVGAAGLFYGLAWLSNLEAGVDKSLVQVVEGIEGVDRLILQTTEVISSTNQSLATVGLATEDTAASLEAFRPLLSETTDVVTNDVPDALDEVQAAIPSLVETAKSVDETLTWISDFQFVIPIPFRDDYIFDFGINYNPEIPLDQAIDAMGGSLEETPEKLRDIEDDLVVADESLALISEDMVLLVADLEAMNSDILAVNTELFNLSDQLEGINSNLKDIQDDLPEKIGSAKQILTGIMVLLFVSQVPPIVLGGFLFSGVFTGVETALEDE